MKISIRDQHTRSAARDARIRVVFSNAPRVDVEVGALGSVDVSVPDGAGLVRLVVSAKRCQRLARELTQNDIDSGVELEVMRTNVWYWLQRGLESPADLLQQVTPVVKYTSWLRLLGAGPGWVATQGPKVRHTCAAAVAVVAACLMVLDVPPFRSVRREVFAGARQVRAWFQSDPRYWLVVRSGEEETLDRTSKVPIGSIRVESGGTLTVEAGAKLLFAPGCGIEVLGRMEARGNESRISFEPQDPAQGWGNIVALAGSTLRLEACDFRGGRGAPLLASKDPSAPVTFATTRDPKHLRGGAILAIAPSECTVSNCTFTDCASKVGGAVCVRQANANVRFDGCSFRSNRAQATDDTSGSVGGAVCLWRADAVFDDCVFSDNSAIKEGSCGGAVYVGIESRPEFMGCTFTNNWCEGQGGAIFANHTHDGAGSPTTPLRIQGNSKKEPSRFVGNRAGPKFEGGAIAIVGKCAVNICFCSFDENVAMTGSAVFLQLDLPDGRSNVPLLLRDNRFEHNPDHTASAVSDLDVCLPTVTAGSISDNEFVAASTDRTARICLTVDKLDSGIASELAGGNGLGPAQLDIGESTLRDVAYIAQAPGLCQATAVAMTLDFLHRDEDPHTPSDIAAIVQRLENAGGLESHAARAQVMNELAPERGPWVMRYAPETVAWTEIVRSIRAGDPVVMSTNFTASGHVVTVIGYRRSKLTRSLLVHDPNGEFLSATPPGSWRLDSQGKRTSGASVLYPFSDLVTEVEYEIAPDATNGETLRYRRRPLDGAKPAWKTASASKLPGIGLSAETPSTTKRDWEYLIQQRHSTRP